MRRIELILWTVVLVQSPCLAQTPYTGEIIRDVPLPVIINGRPRTQATLLDERALVAPSTRPKSEPTEVVENLISFTPESLQLTWSQSGWQLKAGETLLKDFGRNETLARQTLLVLRELRLNQYGTIGQPKPVLEYWLRDGKASEGIPSSVRVVSLDQGSLRVEETYRQWCVRDTYRMLLNFERDETSARRAVAILKKYRFTQFGTLASFPPTLLFLARPGDDLQQVRYAGPASGMPVIQPAAAVQSTMVPSLSVPMPLQPGSSTGASGLTNRSKSAGER